MTARSPGTMSARSLVTRSEDRSGSIPGSRMLVDVSTTTTTSATAGSWATPPRPHSSRLNATAHPYPAADRTLTQPPSAAKNRPMELSAYVYALRKLRGYRKTTVAGVKGAVKTLGGPPPIRDARGHAPEKLTAPGLPSMAVRRWAWPSAAWPPARHIPAAAPNDSSAGESARLWQQCRSLYMQRP